MRTLFLLPLLYCGAIAAADDRPNIIVIFTDDHGFSDMACQGIQTDLKTPYIDAMAAGGIRFTSGYVTAPQCVPSRAGLLSGRYQNRFGVEANGHSLAGFNAAKTIAERLQGSGYATGMTGKWHLGPQPQIVEHGFQDVYYKNANRPGWANFDLDGNDRPPGPEKSELYHLDANTAAACAFIKRHKNEPFFFYCAYRAPHVPLDAPPKYLKRFPGEMPQRRRQALAMISAMDDGVGKIMATLREHKLEEKTLLFFIGDNGAPLKIHKLDAPGGGPGWDGSLNEPLNGEKGMLSEGGIRVPFVAYWKGKFPAGQQYHHPVISLDVAATANALAGLPHDSKLDGVDLTPYLTGANKTAPHETLYWRWIAQSAVRRGQWKYLRGGSREYLFDLDNDREEKKNLLQQHPEIANELRKRLSSWASKLQPPGLETKQMSSTWETYFDHYLDGKLQVPAKSPTVKPNATAVKGWLTRNGSAKLADGVLQVRPPQKGKTKKNQNLFIVVGGIDIPVGSKAIVRLSGKEDGQASFMWRQVGQRDFDPAQTSSFSCKKSAEPQSYQVELPAKEKIIHLRLFVPREGADIESIVLQDKSGKELRSWRFRD